MKGRLRPRLRATRSDVGKKGILKYTLGVLLAVAPLSRGFFDECVGGCKLKLRRLAQHADRETEDDDIMGPMA